MSVGGAGLRCFVSVSSGAGGTGCELLCSLFLSADRSWVGIGCLFFLMM